MNVELNRFDNSPLVVHNLKRYEKKIVIKIHEILRQRDLSLSDLHRMTGIRIASLSELSNARKSTLNIIHIVVIMQALRITDVREIFDIQFNEEVIEEWNEEMEGYEKGLTVKQQKEVEENLKLMEK
ncbi:helix-turn-helix transcriptional regulator [Shouchella miscanthi]|uniref:Helix-turn-helix transcriptional regulator n=1 Tax=Shouchella miscanthi TaxID=2598861 RepID=A0ABU6NJ74_9BACI|nr:helix-turn-helix transcriptional regulator [Shouchella miscanthi]